MSRSSAATTRSRPSLTSGCRMNDDIPDIVAGPGSVPRARAPGVDQVGIRSYVRKALTAFSTSGLACRQRTILFPPSSKGFRGWDELLSESMIAVDELWQLPRHSHMLSMSSERHRLKEHRQGGTIPDAVYVKTLYRIGDQDYCRHHVIRAAVAAGLVTEVRPGAGPVVAMNRGASAMERDRPFQG